MAVVAVAAVSVVVLSAVLGRGRSNHCILGIWSWLVTVVITGEVVVGLTDVVIVEITVEVTRETTEGMIY